MLTHAAPRSNSIAALHSCQRLPRQAAPAVASAVGCTSDETWRAARVGRQTLANERRGQNSCNCYGNGRAAVPLGLVNDRWHVSLIVLGVQSQITLLNTYPDGSPSASASARAHPTQAPQNSRRLTSRGFLPALSHRVTHSPLGTWAEVTAGTCRHHG